MAAQVSGLLWLTVWVVAWCLPLLVWYHTSGGPRWFQLACLCARVAGLGGSQLTAH
jgi:uncharacterized membrane protein YhdT